MLIPNLTYFKIHFSNVDTRRGEIVPWERYVCTFLLVSLKPHDKHILGNHSRSSDHVDMTYQKSMRSHVQSGLRSGYAAVLKF